jgi:hypothetical protein
MCQNRTTEFTSVPLLACVPLLVRRSGSAVADLPSSVLAPTSCGLTWRYTLRVICGCKGAVKRCTANELAVAPADYAATPAMMLALWPPKPKLFDITARNLRSRGVLGV